MLFGENGAGKTNLLEAISLLSPGRGLRRAQPTDFAGINGGETSALWAIAAQLHGADAEKIGTGQVPGSPSRRHVRIDGKAGSGTGLAKLIPMNWLTPAQDRLFAGPASDRRKFLDRLCLIHAPDHGRTSLAYEKSRAERNRLFADGVDDDYWFDALESDLAERGSKIASARVQTASALQEQINIRPQTAFPKADVELSGDAENLIVNGASEAEVYEYIAQALKNDRAVDRRAGRTLRGVHKSDLIVSHREKNMLAGLCSTGEQKALLIGLILAHARAHSGHPPLLLLDEVAAHLDEYRRQALAEDLLDLKSQVFLTGTDAVLFEAFDGRAQSFLVCGGKLTAA